MGVRFLPGFTVLGSSGSICWVSPHSGPSLRFSDSRDDRSELVAHLCWEKTGGKLVISNVSRMRDLGIDFNRQAPDAETAIKAFGKFSGRSKDQQAYYEYKKRYAWVAEGRKDHESRLDVYRSFWNEASSCGTAVMVHRMFTAPTTAESVMDIFTQGSEESEVRDAVEKTNKKYSGFFRKIKADMTGFMELEEKRNIDFIGRTPTDELELEFAANLEKHRSIVGVSRNSEIAGAIGAFMKRVSPEITYRKIFSGSKSYGLENLEGRCQKVVQAEVTSFLGFWYPDKAAEMLCSIVKELGLA